MVGVTKRPRGGVGNRFPRDVSVGRYQRPRLVPQRSSPSGRDRGEGLPSGGSRRQACRGPLSGAHGGRTRQGSSRLLAWQDSVVNEPGAPPSAVRVVVPREPDLFKRSASLRRRKLPSRHGRRHCDDVGFRGPRSASAAPDPLPPAQIPRHWANVAFRGARPRDLARRKATIRQSRLPQAQRSFHRSVVSFRRPRSRALARGKATS